MSTLEMPAAGAAPAAGRGNAIADPAGRVTLVAGALLVAGLALAVGDLASVLAQVAVTGAGAVVALFVLAPLAARRARRRPVSLLLLASPIILGLFAFVVAVVPVVFGASPLVDWLAGLLSVAIRWVPLAIVLVAAVGGLVLIADDLRARLGLGARAPSPWQRLSGAASGATAARPWRAVGGLALIALAAVLGIGVAGAYVGVGGLFGPVIVVAVGGVALAVLGTPVLIAALARADRGRVAAAREDERQRMAAHLHDSVLQTLALVQRQAHDPAAVARLVRRQEHDLRAWMAGEAEPGGETLAGGLRDAVAEVEREHDAVVEVTILGDRPLDEAGKALAAAAREALRNAARHAPASPIFVFAQVGHEGAEVFVRDEGGGFDLASVPLERRGVRDAIVGRMASAGGSATVDSVPGEGTEIALRIVAPREAA